MPETSAVTPDLLPIGREPIHPPMPPRISPAAVSLSIASGQTVTTHFGVIGISESTPVLGQLPSGISGSVTAVGKVATEDPLYSIKLTAAQDLTPVNAEVPVSLLGKPTATSLIRLNAMAQGAVFPTYLVIGLLYAPPGNKAKQNTSQVSYSTGSVTGTSVSIGSSLKTGADISASVGVNAGIPGVASASASVSLDYSQSRTSGVTDSVTISKTTTDEIDVTGPAEDGIDHDYDVFYLWLNPAVAMTVDSKENVSWNLACNGPAMTVQYVYVKWLKNPSLMEQEAPGVAQSLKSAGLTSTDFTTILSLDPFSSGTTAIDPRRFVLASQSSFPYEPPLSATDPVPVRKYTVANSKTSTQAAQAEQQYELGITGSVGFTAGFVNASLKAGATWTWTNTVSQTSTSTTTQSATVTVGGPSAGYSGPTDILVYWDTLYDSFMFAFAIGTPTAIGTIVDGSGAPAANQEVTLTVDGNASSTYTDSRGQYRLYGGAPGQGMVGVAGQHFPVTVTPGTPLPTMHLGKSAR